MPNSFRIYRHEYILCQFLCRFYSEENMTLKRTKMEWIGNEFHVLFQFYSNQKYSFQYSRINFFIPRFMPISFLYYPFYSKFIPNISAWIYSMSIFMPILFRRKHDIKKNQMGMNLEWISCFILILFQAKIFIPI